MRKIKFRLIKDGKIVGFEKHEYNKNPRLEIGVITIFHSTDKENWWNVRRGGVIPHDYKEQYVGIEDVKRVEIYEGDIMKVAELDFIPFIVTFLNCKFVLQNGDETFPLTWVKKPEVIGNIYDIKE